MDPQIRSAFDVVDGRAGRQAVLLVLLAAAVVTAAVLLYAVGVEEARHAGWTESFDVSNRLCDATLGRYEDSLEACIEGWVASEKQCMRERAALAEACSR